jgi:hypothetical protein
VNNGILTSGHAPPPMPYGLLGTPTPVPMVDLYAYDADATRYIEAVERADRQRLELSVRQVINQFVLGCKSDGIWSAIKASCILMGARTLAGALTPLAGTAPTNVNFVSGDYNRKTGLIGNGANKYLNSNRANNADPQNSAHLSVYVSAADTAGANTSRVYAGVGNGSGGLFSFLEIARLNAVGGGLLTGIGAYNRTADFSSIATLNTPGFLGHSRAASASFTGRGGGASTTITRTSTSAAAATPLAVFAENFGGTLSSYTNGRIAFYSIGESLDIALLDSRVTALYNAIGAATP